THGITLPQSPYGGDCPSEMRECLPQQQQRETGNKRRGSHGGGWDGSGLRHKTRNSGRTGACRPRPAARSSRRGRRWMVRRGSISSLSWMQEGVQDVGYRDPLPEPVRGRNAKRDFQASFRIPKGSVAKEKSQAGVTVG